MRQICAFYMLNVLSPLLLYICAMGGVIEVGFLRSAGFGMAKAQGKRQSRLILGEFFPEIAFSFVCVIVLMRVFCFAKNSVSSALRCDIFPENVIIS